MHLIGHGTMNSPYIMFLQREEISFELDFIGNQLKKGKNNDNCCLIVEPIGYNPDSTKMVFMFYMMTFRRR